MMHWRCKMKAIVIYDSTYGNTEKIAQSIGSAIGSGAKVVRISSVNPSDLDAVDLLVFGSPTQGGRATEAMQAFLNKLPDSAIKGKNIAVFDTRMTMKIAKLFGYAAGKMYDNLKKRGGNFVALPEPFYVTSSKGPLKDGEIERAANWGKELGKGKS